MLFSLMLVARFTRRRLLLFGVLCMHECVVWASRSEFAQSLSERVKYVVVPCKPQFFLFVIYRTHTNIVLGFPPPPRKHCRSTYIMNSLLTVRLPYGRLVILRVCKTQDKVSVRGSQRCDSSSLCPVSSH